MILEWDEAKRRSNIAKHGLDFADIRFLDWDRARFVEDTRRKYPEPRFWAFAKRAGELYVIVFCIRGACHQFSQSEREGVEAIWLKRRTNSIGTKRPS